MSRKENIGGQTRLLAIFDADSTWIDELRYLLNKCAGREGCALCDISHGWNPIGKPAWRRQRRGTSQITWVHRDELPEHLQAMLADQLPCVVAQAAGDTQVVMSREALAACRGDFATFERLLEEKLRALTH